MIYLLLKLPKYIVSKIYFFKLPSYKFLEDIKLLNHKFYKIYNYSYFSELLITKNKKKYFIIYFIKDFLLMKRLYYISINLNNKKKYSIKSILY